MKRALFGFFLLLIFLQEGFARDSTPKQIGLFIVATGKYQEQFDCLDYIFAIDADALFVAPVGEEIFSDRVFTLHPGFVNRAGTYERNPLSAACVASH